MATIHPHGFYKTNLGAVTLRELFRRFGFSKFLRAVISYRFKNHESAFWMPAVLAYRECLPEELSPRFWEITTSSREMFQRLGFTEFAFTRVKPEHNLNFKLRDNGCLRFVHANRAHLGSLTFFCLRQSTAAKIDRDKLEVSFTAAFKETTLSYVNSAGTIEGISGHQIFRVPNASAQVLYQHFTNHLERLNEKPIAFADNTVLRHWFDEKQIDTFNERIKRGFFIKMTDAEVEKFRRNLPPAVLPKI